jgi:hypothetical protein
MVFLSHLFPSAVGRTLNQRCYVAEILVAFEGCEGVGDIQVIHSSAARQLFFSVSSCGLQRASRHVLLECGVGVVVLTWGPRPRCCEQEVRTEEGAGELLWSTAL